MKSMRDGLVWNVFTSCMYGVELIKMLGLLQSEDDIFDRLKSLLEIRFILLKLRVRRF